jgi:hypothetical protein
MKSVFRHCRFGVGTDATVHVGLRELVFGVLCKHPRAGDRLLYALESIGALKDQKLSDVIFA